MLLPGQRQSGTPLHVSAGHAPSSSFRLTNSRFMSTGEEKKASDGGNGQSAATVQHGGRGADSGRGNAPRTGGNIEATSGSNFVNRTSSAPPAGYGDTVAMGGRGQFVPFKAGSQAPGGHPVYAPMYQGNQMNPNQFSMPFPYNHPVYIGNMQVPMGSPTPMPFPAGAAASALRGMPPGGAGVPMHAHPTQGAGGAPMPGGQGGAVYAKHGASAGGQGPMAVPVRPQPAGRGADGERPKRSLRSLAKLNAHAKEFIPGGATKTAPSSTPPSGNGAVAPPAANVSSGASAASAAEVALAPAADTTCESERDGDVSSSAAKTPSAVTSEPERVATVGKSPPDTSASDGDSRTQKFADVAQAVGSPADTEASVSVSAVGADHGAALSSEETGASASAPEAAVAERAVAGPASAPATGERVENADKPVPARQSQEGRVASNAVSLGGEGSDPLPERGSDGVLRYPLVYLLQFKHLDKRPPNLGDAEAVVSASTSQGTGEGRGRSMGESVGRDAIEQMWGNSRGARAPRSGRTARSAGSARQDDGARAAGGRPGTAASRRAARAAHAFERSMATNTVQLTRSSNAWRPQKPDSDVEATLKKGLALLNKITLEKFDIILQQILEVGIKDAEPMRKFIKVIFDKALTEPTYAFMYADLCAKLAAELPEFPADEEDGKPIAFKRLLLNRCQEEFESGMETVESLRKKHPDETDAFLEEMRTKLRRRSLGNIQFIGELYKKKMLSERIMHECIRNLLRGQDGKRPGEDDIEALCKLLGTIGRRLDRGKSKSKEYVDKYFEHIAVLCKDKTYSSRTRFMLQDVIELRGNGWVPRRQQETAKTIEEIRAAAELELMQSEGGGRGGRGGGRGGSTFGGRGGRGVPAGGGSAGAPGAEEWIQVGGRSRDAGATRMAAGGATAGLGGARHNPYEPDSYEPMPRGAGGGAGRGFAPRGSPGGDAGSSPASSSSHSGGGSARTPSDMRQLSESELQEKYKKISTDFLNSNDKEQVVESLDGLSRLDILITELVCQSLEKTSTDRYMAAMLVKHLHAKKLIQAQDVHEALPVLFDLGADLIYDLPKVYELLGEVLAFLMVSDVLTLGIFSSKSVAPHAQQGSLEKTLVGALKTLKEEEKTAEKVRQRLEEQQFSLQSVLRSDSPQDLQAFLSQPGMGELFPNELHIGKLNELLSANAKDEAIIEYLADKVPAETVASPSFAMRVVAAVLTHAIQSEAIEDQIAKFAPVLQKMCADEDAQVLALFEAQKACLEAGEGKAEPVFSALYESATVTESALNAWQSSTRKGYGSKTKIIMQLSSFLSRLRSAPVEINGDA